MNGKVYCNGTRIKCLQQMELTVGMVGAEVEFDFSEEWDGLGKLAVFRSDGSRDVIVDENGVAVVPHEILTTPGMDVEVGVYAVREDGTTWPAPTPFCKLTRNGIAEGADPSGDESYPPTPDVGEQAVAAASKALEAAAEAQEVAADIQRRADAGEFDGRDGAQGEKGDKGDKGDPGTGAVELDPTLTQSGKAADAKAVGDALANISGVTVEPAEDDIPKVFFGGALQQTKDEAVVPFRYISKTEDVSGYAEIKAQGNSTLMWPKKNQTVKLYKDAGCTEKLKVGFKGWGKQNKFVIKANWRDLTHVRDIVSVRLEGDCMRCNPDYDELPELLKTSPNMGGIDGFPVVVYAAGVYQGRYMWNIPKDKWMANMDDDLDEHCILCSEDYNSSLFRAAANINGSDWTDEIHDTVPESIKTRWNEVISFVMTSSDEEFVANLDSYIKVSTLIDRHLMGLLSCDFDGYGKNQLYLTYDGQQWYAGRYDKDGTWGNYWSGNSMLPFDYGREQYEDMISGRPGNLLFIRLEQLFWSRLQTRWAELRVGPLSIPNIINRFRELYDITPPYLIAEDYASTTANGAFTGIPNKDTCTIQQIQKFVVERHAWMDEYIASLTPEEAVPCTGITLSASELTFTGSGTQTLTATVEPENTTDTVVWRSDDTSVATVSGGVVTAKGNGSCVITATCGEQSASCEVTVSGIVVQYSVTNTLLGVTSSNASAAVGEGDTYTATLTAKDGYTLEGATVAVTMGGVDITSTAYSGGVITITNVTGNIVIAVAAVDTSVAYSHGELVMNAVSGSGIDTGVMLQDETKDYTLFFDFTPVYSAELAEEGETIREYFFDNEAITEAGWAGYESFFMRGAVSGSLACFGEILIHWSNFWDKRQKVVIRFSNGVYSYAVNGATALTSKEGTEQWVRNHSNTLKIGQDGDGSGAFNGTIHGVKVWFEAKTDEECLAMVNS